MKVTKEQMKSYKSTLTQEEGEAQLREDYNSDRTRFKWRLLCLVLDLIVVILLINCLISH